MRLIDSCIHVFSWELRRLKFFPCCLLRDAEAYEGHEGHEESQDLRRFQGDGSSPAAGKTAAGDEGHQSIIKWCLDEICVYRSCRKVYHNNTCCFVLIVCRNYQMF